MGLLGDAAGSLGINILTSAIGNEISSDTARKNLDYQMNRYYSPAAQVRNLAAAGINPAVAFGNQSPTFNSGGSFSMPNNPFQGIGTTSLTDLANYMNARSNEKKVGADTRKTDAEADAIQFENELNRIFKQPERVANLLAAYKSMQLKEDEHSINEWRKAKEQALSELAGIERDSAKKTFNNMDTVIKQENKQRDENIKLTQEKQKTEKSQQSANTASARASNAAADYSQSQKKYQDIVNDIKESGKTFELENLIRGYQAENKVKDAAAEQAYTMLARYKQLNDNDKNAAAKYLNYMFWFIKEQMPNLPVVPYIKGN